MLPVLSMKVSSADGAALAITPSFVTGLYTDNKMERPAASGNPAIRIKVTVDGSIANITPRESSDGVLLDERRVPVSGEVIIYLEVCDSSTSSCSSLIDRTLSARSFNFYAINLPKGAHRIEVAWGLAGGTADDVACAGPVALSVHEVRNAGVAAGQLPSKTALTTR